MQQLFDEGSNVKSATEIGQAILAARSILLTDIVVQMSVTGEASLKRIQRFLKGGEPRSAFW